MRSFCVDADDEKDDHGAPGWSTHAVFSGAMWSYAMPFGIMWYPGSAVDRT